MEEFMFLVRGYDGAKASPEEMENRMKAYRVWMEKVTQLGRYKAGNPLDPTSGRMVMDKKTILTDGPFLEAKEIIGGYVLITAHDYDEAISMAKECPLLDHCHLEVRKVGKM